MRFERWLYTIPLKLRSLLRRQRVERELDEELRYHVERQTELNIAAGMSRERALTEALRAFGGIERHKEDARDARGVRLLEEVMRDLRHALRLAAKHPVFSGIVVLSLGLGLGATTAVFSVTYNVLLARLPLPHPEELVALERVGRDNSDDSFSWGEYRSLRETGGGATLAAVRTASAVSIAAGNTRLFVNMHFVDGELLSLLGVRPEQGRLIGREDDARGAPVVVLSRQFVEQLFPGDSSPVGKTVLIRGAPFAVVGVTPGSFRGLSFPGGFTAAIPLSTVPLLSRDGSGRDDRGNRFAPDDRLGTQRAFQIIGRIPRGNEGARVRLATAFERCCAIASGQEPEKLQIVDISRGISSKGDFRRSGRTIAALLLAGMGLVLVVVCCNIASLLLVRASARQREIAVRLSLGASRRRLVSQLLLENAPLALAGGVAGLVVAWMSTGLLIRALPADWDVIADFFRFNGGPAVMLFSGSLTVFCGLAFAVYPALRATRHQFGDFLRLAARGTRSRSQGHIARGAVVAQVAVTVVLVTAASLLAASLARLAQADGGFAAERVLLASIESRSTPYEQQGVNQLSDEILQRVRLLPGVRAAAMSTWVPLFGGLNSWLRTEVPGHSDPAGKPIWERINIVRPGYFAASGVRLMTGRDFTTTDVAGSEVAIVVSDAFAKRYFGEQDPIGRSISIAQDDSVMSPARIVGVAANVVLTDLRESPEPIMYLHLPQARERLRNMQLLVRTEGEPMRLAPTVVRAIDAVAPGIQVRRMRDMQTQREASTAAQRIAARLAAFVSMMALVLSAIGLYGVVAYGVARRTSELGIRMALGARSRAIVWLVVRQTLAFLGLGIAIGLPLSYAANGAMAAQLFGVSAHDPALSAAAILVLAAVALIASITPARRATRIDPRIALSAE
jgi:putative ABC transport system permease protein